MFKFKMLEKDNRKQKTNKKKKAEMRESPRTKQSPREDAPGQKPDIFSEYFSLLLFFLNSWLFEKTKWSKCL